MHGMRAFTTPLSSSITVGDPKPLNRFVFHLPVLFNTALSAYTEQHVWQDDVEKCTQHVKQPESERLVVLLCPPSGAHGSLQPGLCLPVPPMLHSFSCMYRFGLCEIVPCMQHFAVWFRASALKDVTIF